MIDSRPIHERVDLTYIHRRHWPWSMINFASLALAGVTLLSLMGLALAGDGRAFDSGDLTAAHAMFGGRCESCHQADQGASSGGSFWLPATDAACLRCHAAPLHAGNQREFVGSAHSIPGHGSPVVMSAGCASCHVEHKGRDHDLRALSDRVCVSCHQDLSKAVLPAAAGERVPSELRGEP